MALNSINVANTFDAKLQLTLWHRKEQFSSAVPSYLYFMKFGTLISTWKNKIISEKEKNDIIELRKSWWIFFQDFYERFHWSDRWLRAINDGFSCHWEPQLKELLFGVFFCWILFNARTRWQCMCKQLMLQNKYLSISIRQAEWYIASLKCCLFYFQWNHSQSRIYPHCVFIVN